jgi:thioredoxin 1
MRLGLRFLFLFLILILGLSQAGAVEKPLQVTAADFKTEILKSKLPVLVDVGATWCVPCRELSPLVEKMTGVYSGKLKVAQMDADQNAALVEQLNIQAFPTLLFFKNGKISKTIVGSLSEKDLRSAIDHFLKSAGPQPTVKPAA